MEPIRAAPGGAFGIADDFIPGLAVTHHSQELQSLSIRQTTKVGRNYDRPLPHGRDSEVAVNGER